MKIFRNWAILHHIETVLPQLRMLGELGVLSPSTLARASAKVRASSSDLVKEWNLAVFKRSLEWFTAHSIYSSNNTAFNGPLPLFILTQPYHTSCSDLSLIPLISSIRFFTNYSLWNQSKSNVIKEVPFQECNRALWTSEKHKSSLIILNSTHILWNVMPSIQCDCQRLQPPIFSSEILSKIWVNSCISE